MKSSDVISILAALLLTTLQLAAACELFFNEFLHICQIGLFQLKLNAIFHLIKLSENDISSASIKSTTLQSSQNFCGFFLPQNITFITLPLPIEITTYIISELQSQVQWNLLQKFFH